MQSKTKQKYTQVIRSGVARDGGGEEACVVMGKPSRHKSTLCADYEIKSAESRVIQKLSVQIRLHGML